MKLIHKLIVTMLFMAVAVNSYAVKSEDITMIVTSDGATKDEAIKNALRNAIEQTYGVFVSANTNILNDEIVSDEIATVASGNIKSYKELSSLQSDSKTTVTLEAVVSVGKLISYAKSKGAECELDGASMFADIQLKELYKENEEKAVESVLPEIKSLFSQGYDYELGVKETGKPDYYGRKKEEDIPMVEFKCRIAAILNKNGELAWTKLIDLLEGLTKGINSDYGGSVLIPSGILGELDGKTYPLRSGHSSSKVNELIYKLPDIIANVYLDFGSLKVIPESLYDAVDFDKYDMRRAREMRARPYRKNIGAICGIYTTYIKIPIDEIKQIRNVVIKHADNMLNLDYVFDR